MNYTEITSIEQWQQVLATSNEQPILVLKHSTTCPISAAAYSEFTAVDFEHAYLVKVIESRDVSNEIAANLDVQHASPQAIVIKDGKASWQATHHAVTAKAIEEAIA
ncbi:bacillithiol system redox-active protein YtxJ [Caryophanon tenue]|uniref:General stress protein n=1 Tax=Caryophanon tenue TaxID=33978 RepID=A0A1C0YBV4_9BACL|nr:bacillithiol system redox-active protein YtxJ [Caryophanon tenue]OCS84613.1 general stress protein [Caryophanon tenue]